MRFGTTNIHGTDVPYFGTRRNTLILGKHQTGKSTLMMNLALDDIRAGLPVMYFNDDILPYIPRSRVKDVVLFEPFTHPFAFNILADIPEEKHPVLTSTILNAFKGAWHYDQTPTPNIDLYVRAGILTLLKVKGTSLVSLKFLLTDDNYRARVLNDVLDVLLKDFWSDYEEMSLKDRRQETASTLNKVWAFILEPYIRNVLDQRTNKLVLKDKVVIVSFRNLGNENAALLGALILSQLYMEGVEGLEQNLYIDDAAPYGTSVLASVLTCPSVNTTISLHYLDQIHRDFPIMSLGQLLAFRTSVEDARTLGREIEIRPGLSQLHELQPFQAYHALDGVAREIQADFLAYGETGYASKIRKWCHRTYSAPQADVEKRLRRFFDD